MNKEDAEEIIIKHYQSTLKSTISKERLSQMKRLFLDVDDKLVNKHGTLFITHNYHIISVYVDMKINLKWQLIENYFLICSWSIRAGTGLALSFGHSGNCTRTDLRRNVGHLENSQAQRTETSIYRIDAAKFKLQTHLQLLHCCIKV